MALSAQLIEDKVIEAAGAYSSGDYTTIKAAADAVGAPVQRVSRRLRGIPSEISKGGQNKKLDEPQERAVGDVVKRYNDLGLSLNPRKITQVANSILRGSAGSDVLMHSVGPGWGRRYLKRHPEFVVKRKKPREVNRHAAQTQHRKQTVEQVTRRHRRTSTFAPSNASSAEAADATGGPICQGFGSALLDAIRMQELGSTLRPLNLQALSRQRCLLFLQHYEDMAQAAPFAIRLPNESLDDLLTTLPVFLLSVLLTACSSATDVQEEADQLFRHVLAQRVIVQGERSMELLQGLLTYLLWYHQRFNPETQQYYQLLQLAIGMTADLGLFKGSATKDLNQLRAFLLCYYLSCGAGILGYDRPQNMQYVDSLRQAARLLAQTSDAPLDKHAPAICELMSIVARQRSLWTDSDGSMTFPEWKFVTAMEIWKAAHLLPETPPAVKSSYHFISAYGLLKRLDSTPPPPRDIRACLGHFESLLSDILSQDSSYVVRLGSVEWAHLLTTLFLLPALESIAERDAPALSYPGRPRLRELYVGRLRTWLGELRVQAKVKATLVAPTFFAWVETILAAVEKQTERRGKAFFQRLSLPEAQGEGSAHELVNAFMDDESDSLGRHRHSSTDVDELWTDFMSDWLNW